MAKTKTISVRVTEAQNDLIEMLIEHGVGISKPDILRQGLRALHDDVDPPSTRHKTTNPTKKQGSTANQSEVDKLRQEREAKAAKRQAEIELLKEEKSDILSEIDDYEVSEDSEHNAWLHWQYFQKRGGELQSWRADYRLDRIHDDLATLPQYQPDKESIINLLENGGNVILHNKHEDYDTIPDDIKSYL